MHQSPRFTVPSPWPSHWWGGDAVRTHVGNTFSLFFPDGERGLIRTLRAVSPEVKRAVGEERIARFCLEEAAHAREHQRFLEPLADSKVARAMSRISRALFRTIDRTPLRVRLALGAAAEHAASSFARVGFELRFTEDAVRPMRDLFEWHAKEEIRHREVVFDAFVANGGWWPMRMLAYLVTSTILLTYFTVSTVALLVEDRALMRVDTWRSGLQLTMRALTESSALRLAVAYLVPGFHPRNDGSDVVLAQL